MARRTAAALALAALALGGCSGGDEPTPGDRTSAAPEPRFSATQAQRVYSQTLDEIARAALQGNPVVATPRFAPDVVYLDGATDQCTYSGRLELDGVVFGEDVPWDDVRTATEEAAVDHGFTLTDQLEIPGGYNGFDAATDRGARLEVRSKLGQPSTLEIHAPVTGTCSGEVNQTLKPLAHQRAANG